MVNAATPRGDVSTGNQSGFASVALPLTLWLAVVAAIVVIDVGGYVIAAARAQAVADAAALAAAAASAPTIPRSAQQQAEQAAEINGGRLEDCYCPTAGGQVRVEISVAVSGLFVPRVGASRVTAEAQAEMRHLTPQAATTDKHGGRGYRQQAAGD